MYADLLLFSLRSQYKCCISYICCIAAKFAGYVDNSPKNFYTAFCLSYFWLVSKIVYANLFIFQGVFGRKNWFWGDLLLFSICTTLLLPILKIFHC